MQLFHVYKVKVRHQHVCFLRGRSNNFLKFGTFHHFRKINVDYNLSARELE